MAISKQLFRNQRGIGIVDMMVGMVIGLIGMLVVFQSFSAFEAQKRSTTTANDAQDSGLMALTAIERDVRLAGYGLFSFYSNVNRLACEPNTMRESVSGVASTVTLMPARIIDGGAGVSDTIEVTYSTSGFAATPSPLRAGVVFDGSAATIDVSNTANATAYSAGQYILVGSNTQPCTKLQVSGVTNMGSGITRIAVAPGPSYPANPASLPALLPGTYDPGSNTSNAKAWVINMGAMTRGRYQISLDANFKGGLQYQDIRNGNGTPVTLADGIVNMQAQYGIVASTATGATQQTLADWVEPTGAPWGTPGKDETTRIKALRIAVVARSQLLEKDPIQSVDQTCTNPSGTNNNGPCAWRDTTADPAPTINLTGDPNWQRYRYRVYETIVPLRNMMWQIQ